MLTTAATTQDSSVGPLIQQALADHDLLPGTHLLDSGYVDADVLVSAQMQHQIDVVGPPFGSYSWQRRAGNGYDLQAFAIDWDAQVATCPQGQRSVKWTPGHDVSGDPVIRIRFGLALCRACPARHLCTATKRAPRQLTVRPQPYHIAIQQARQRQTTADFQVRYALRAGVESSIAQATRRFDLRHCRYIGVARTHLQQVVTAVAINLVRVIAWLWNEPLDERRRGAGHVAQLAPRPLSRRAMLC